MFARAAIVCLAACGLPLAACGEDEEQRVRAALDAFVAATASKDYQRLCDDLFAERLVERIRRTLPCEVALRNSSLEDARDPKLVVERVTVEGERASALVVTSAANQPASKDTVRLVKEGGGWRIASLTS